MCHHRVGTFLFALLIALLGMTASSSAQRTGIAYNGYFGHIYNESGDPVSVWAKAICPPGTPSVESCSNDDGLWKFPVDVCDGQQPVFIAVGWEYCGGLCSGCWSQYLHFFPEIGHHYEGSLVWNCLNHCLEEPGRAGMGLKNE